VYPVATGAENQPVARHPHDPDPVRATKAHGVLALGIVAVGTAVAVGGIIPALLALAMARQCRAEMRAAGGFLTGGRLLRAGERLAWTAVVIVITVLVVLAVSGVLRLAPTPP
jgi:hypothetical protein